MAAQTDRHRPARVPTWCWAAAFVTLMTVTSCGPARKDNPASIPSKPSAGPHVSTLAPGRGSWAVPVPGIVLSCSDEALFQPTGAATSGLVSPCGHFTVGASLADADCSKGSIPATLNTQVYDQNTVQPSDRGSITTVSGGCQLLTRSRNVIAQVGPNLTLEPPGSVIVIADFVPPASSSIQFIGMDVRCQPSGASETCLTVLMDSVGGYGVYQMDPSGGVVLVQGNFKNDKIPAPRLTPGQPNRLVFWVSGERGAAYLNGRLLGEGPTSLPDVPSLVDFTAVPGGAFDGGSGESAVVSLIHLAVFQAA